MGNSVNPIISKYKIEQVLKYLKQRSYRDYILFFLGVNTGLRISDILRLNKYSISTDKYIYIREKKTNKLRKVIILAHVKKEMYKYIKCHVKDNYYLFPSKYRDFPICSKRYYQIMKKIQKKFNLPILGTHTLRKTFAYHYYQKNKDIGTLMRILNHERESQTLLYIGVTQQMIDLSIERWGGFKAPKNINYRVIK